MARGQTNQAESALQRIRNDWSHRRAERCCRPRLLKPLRKLRDKVNFVLIVNDRPQKGIKPIAPFACLVELHLDAKPLEQGSDLGGCLAALLQMAFSSMQRSANMESVALKAPDIVAQAA